jgi:hypothetical protein
MPAFAIGEVKNDVPASYQRFVGVWVSKVGAGNGKGRQAMIIVTDVVSDGTVLGYYVSGPPTKLSWAQTAGGYAGFATKLVDGNLQFKLGQAATMNAKLSGDNAMILQATNELPGKLKSAKSITKLYPIWRFIAQDNAVTSKR